MKICKLPLFLLTLGLMTSCGTTDISSNSSSSSQEEISSYQPIVSEYEYTYNIDEHEFKYIFRVEEHQDNWMYYADYYFDGKKIEKLHNEGNPDNRIMSLGGMNFKVENDELKLVQANGGIEFVCGYEIYAATYDLMPDSTHVDDIFQGKQLILNQDGTGKFLDFDITYYPLTNNNIVLINETGKGIVVTIILAKGNEATRYYVPIKTDLSINFSYPVDIDSYYDAVHNYSKIYYGTGYFDGYVLYIGDGTFAIEGQDYFAGTCTLENGVLTITNPDGESEKIILNDEVMKDGYPTFDLELDRKIKHGTNYINYYKNGCVYAYTSCCSGQFLSVSNVKNYEVIAVYWMDYGKVLVFNETLDSYYEIEGSEYIPPEDEE